MTRENDRYRSKMGLTMPDGDSELDRMIEETEVSVMNTRNFLERIQLSEVENKRYIQQISDNLEGSLKNLKRKRDSAIGERLGGRDLGPSQEK